MEYAVHFGTKNEVWCFWCSGFIESFFYYCYYDPFTQLLVRRRKKHNGFTVLLVDREQTVKLKDDSWIKIIR